MSKIIDTVTGFALPVIEELGMELWDVEYVREGVQMYLRIYIDKPEGVGIADCEAVSRAVDPILDERDPIEESYIFEVSSAGLTRQLKKPAHFERLIGETIELKLYAPSDGSKIFSGELLSYSKGAVTIRYGDGERIFEKGQYAAATVSLL